MFSLDPKVFQLTTRATLSTGMACWEHDREPPHQDERKVHRAPSAAQVLLLGVAAWEQANASKLARARTALEEIGVSASLDLATLSVEEQALTVAKSKVFISNHGGGSASSLFLQTGATLILFFSVDRIGKRDDTLYDSIGYFRTDWMSVKSTAEEVLNHVELALLQP